MHYLDNAATSFPKAPGVNEAIARFITEDAANPGRSGHRMAKAAEAMLDRVRLKLARLVRCPSPKQVIFTLNATDALNLGIKGALAAPLAQGRKVRVITTELEHNSVSRPLQALAEQDKIELLRIGASPEGYVDIEAMCKAIQEGAYMVVMTHASNVLGTIQDAATVGACCRANDCLFFLDVAQTIGAIDIDMHNLNADLLAFPGHKSLMGPTGTGALILGERVPSPSEDVQQLDRFVSLREGGTGGDSKTPVQPEEMPYALEAGTPNTIGLAGLEAGIDWVLDQGMDNLLAHERALTAQLIDGLQAIDGVTVYGDLNPLHRTAVVSFNLDAYPTPMDVAMILDDSFDIAIRPGLHCAPYAHQAIGTFPDGTLRVSPGPLTTQEEITIFLDAISQIACV